MTAVTREYTTADGALTVEWRAPLCTHCENCYYELPLVFNPNRRPWVDLSRDTTAKITDVVNNCPSKALSIKEQQ